MNIPTMKDKTKSLFNLHYFRHDEEMENLAKHLYLEYKGARTGIIGGNDPFEDPIIGITPKGFTLLMLARLNLCFRPVASNPLVGIMVEVPLPFGNLAVYSTMPNCWTDPMAATQHLGFTMMYKKLPNTLGDTVIKRYQGFHVIPEPSTELLVLGSAYNIGEETYLNDLCDEMCSLIHGLRDINDELSTLAGTDKK